VEGTSNDQEVKSRSVYTTYHVPQILIILLFLQISHIWRRCGYLLVELQIWVFLTLEVNNDCNMPLSPLDIGAFILRSLNDSRISRAFWYFMVYWWSLRNNLTYIWYKAPHGLYLSSAICRFVQVRYIQINLHIPMVYSWSLCNCDIYLVQSFSWFILRCLQVHIDLNQEVTIHGWRVGMIRW
jgi:hypothetical protein